MGLSLGLIFFIMLMDVVGISILYPVAPYIVRRYSGDALMVTMLTVIYAAAQFFAAPVLGKLGDRYGRRPVLLVSVFGSAIGYVIFGIGGALWVLFLLADLPNYRAQQSRERFHLSHTYRAQCQPRVATRTGRAHGCDHCTRQPDEHTRPAVGGCGVRPRDARRALLDGRSHLCAGGTHARAAHSTFLFRPTWGIISSRCYKSDKRSKRCLARVPKAMCQI